MQAHDRTMLAQLGFADADRRQPLHDLACRYLATPAAIRGLVRHLGIEQGPAPARGGWNDTEQLANVSRKVVSHQVTFEHEIAKGSGQYRTTVGFADLVLKLRVEEKCSCVRQRRRSGCDAHGCPLWSDWQTVRDQTYQTDLALGIEVKVQPVAIGNLLRQVKLYRSYSAVEQWMVATPYDLSSSEVQYLRNEGVLHARLGARFEAFVASEQGAIKAVSPEV